MKNLEERKSLIEDDRNFVTFPPPDYSKLSNEQIRERTKVLKRTFELAFSEDDNDDLDDDI